MMLAVPLHGDDVAPRFCSADHFVIAEQDGRRTRLVRRLTFPEATWSRRLERLSAAGVRVLLCGGFNRSFLPHAEALGIRVISGLAGRAEQLINAFAREQIEQYRFVPGRGRRRGHQGADWRSQSHQRELRQLRERKGVGKCRDTTEQVRWDPDRARDKDWGAADDALKGQQR